MAHAKSVTVPPSKPRLLDVLGPGLITGASDDDPSGIATYSQAGARFGFALTWTLLFSYPLMSAVQLVSARLGRTTGHGIAGNLARHYPNWLLQGIVLLLVAANTINLGADLGAMADATQLVIGGTHLAYVFAFGVACALMQVLLKYTRYVAVLKWLTLALLAYVATLAFVRLPWGEIARSLVMPELQWNKSYLSTIVAVLGTTISPYLFFWQASQEVEDIHEHPKRAPLVLHPEQGPSAIDRIRLDTLVGMAFSNLVALAIMITAAATLRPRGFAEIATAAQAAEALKPIAGNYAAMMFAVGIVGTGLLAVPVLAGSAAYAVGEARRWPVGLARQPMEAKAFYMTIVAATLIGTGLNLTSVNPIAALYWTAVINGVIAVPVMVVMMLMVARPDIMGRWVIGPRLRLLGWLTTAVMTACVAGMLAAAF